MTDDSHGESAAGARRGAVAGGSFARHRPVRPTSAIVLHPLCPDAASTMATSPTRAGDTGSSFHQSVNTLAAQLKDLASDVHLAELLRAVRKGGTGTEVQRLVSMCSAAALYSGLSDAPAANASGSRNIFLASSTAFTNACAVLRRWMHLESVSRAHRSSSTSDMPSGFSEAMARDGRLPEPQPSPRAEEKERMKGRQRQKPKPTKRSIQCTVDYLIQCEPY